VKRSFVFRNVT